MIPYNGCFVSLPSSSVRAKWRRQMSSQHGAKRRHLFQQLSGRLVWDFWLHRTPPKDLTLLLLFPPLSQMLRQLLTCSNIQTEPTRPSWIWSASGSLFPAPPWSPTYAGTLWRKRINGRCGAARTPQQSSKRPRPTQGPHCVSGNSSLTVLRWLPLLKSSQRLLVTPTKTGPGCRTQGRWQERGGARALGPRWRPGPARRPRAGAAAPGGGAKPCGPPAPGREAPSPRPSRRAADARRCVRPLPPRTLQKWAHHGAHPHAQGWWHACGRKRESRSWRRDAERAGGPASLRGLAGPAPRAREEEAALEHLWVRCEAGLSLAASQA